METLIEALKIEDRCTSEHQSVFSDQNLGGLLEREPPERKSPVTHLRSLKRTSGGLDRLRRRPLRFDSPRF